MATENPFIVEMKKRGNLGAQTDDVDPSDGSDEYQQLRQQNFKALLDSQIQLSAARQNSMKQTQSQINASGFGGTGYGSMQQSSINNAFINALQSAKNNYQTQQQSIANQEQTANDTDSSTNFNNFLSILNSDAANSTDGMNKTLESYGFMNNGNLIDEASFKNLGYSTNDYNQLKSIYALKSSAYNTSETIANKTVNGTGFNDYQDASSNIKTENGVDASDDKWGVKNELDYLFNTYTTKDTKNGDVVKLQNANNGTSGRDYVYMIYQNGRWYQTSANLVDTSKAVTISGKKVIS